SSRAIDREPARQPRCAECVGSGAAGSRNCAAVRSAGGRTGECRSRNRQFGGRTGFRGVHGERTASGQKNRKSKDVGKSPVLHGFWLQYLKRGAEQGGGVLAENWRASGPFCTQGPE